MRLLVTGGAGYIGSVVTHQLAAAGHDVAVLDDLSTGFELNIPEGVQFHRLNVRDVSKILTKDAGFDGVLHFACKIEVAESMARPDAYWRANIGGSLAVLDAMRAARTPKLIFSSTGSVYRANDQGPLTERSPLEPTNPHAVSALTVDMMLAAEARAYGLGAVSLRYFNAAGALGNLGERHMPESHLIPIAVRAAAGWQDSVRLDGDDYPTPDGTCIRDYIHISDLARAHLLALEWIEPGRHEVFNLGNGNGYSNKQVIQAVGEVSGRAVPVRVGPRRPGDFMVSVAGSEKARRELGWVPQRPDLIDIIGDAWRFHAETFGVP